MLAIIINYYSPVAWSRPVDNYKQAIASIRRQVPRESLFLVELHFDRDEPIDPDAKFIRGQSCHQYLWQKETIFNAVCRQLPPHYDKFLMLDADILFDDDDWYQRFSDSLDVYDYSQPFSHCSWLDRHGEVAHTKLSCALAPTWPSFGRYHPGFGIGLTRKAFEVTDGVAWRSISGANDCLIPWSFFPGGQRDPHRMNARAGEMPAVYAYREAIQSAGLTLGFSVGSVRHLWHGDRDNRQYHSRHVLLNKVGYKVSDVRVDENGLFAWVDDNCPAKRAMRKYFYRRKEDG
jgi:hypothetical protein